ncbi:MAG: Stp1/IreP family PP2C-type Ser/Thr phosphatase [Chloroflexi bacterium]|nr:Stp1/IreP family PP2C-type Ser/Thr phosphatase [Chloroflexota bacterium]
MTDAPRAHPPGSHGFPESDAPTGQLRPPQRLAIEVFGETNPGRVRPGNEDNLTWEDPAASEARTHGTLLVVSDGMGGHAAGEVASEIAVRTVRGRFYQSRSLPVGDAIREAITVANDAIYQAAQRHREQAGMGCTVVAMVVHDGDLTVGHVGDSRGYLIRGGRATQLTLDHSWVAMQVKEGILTPEQAEHHPNRSVLLRALGRQPGVEADVSQVQLQAGDILLLCSDGLTGMVSDAEIAEQAVRVPARELPHQLIELANARGAPDNVTVLIGHIVPADGAAATPVLDDRTTTLLAGPAGSRLQSPDAAPGNMPTDRLRPRGPAAPADQTVPLGVPAPAAGGAAGPGATAGGSPRGRPVVRARSTSVQTAGGLSELSRGRGRWIAGALAAFGLAAGLILISLFQLTRDSSPPTAASTSAAAQATAAPPAAAQPTAVPTVPPPISSQLPAAQATVTTPPQPGIPTISAMLPTPPASVATPAPSPNAVGSPAPPLQILPPSLATAQTILTPVLPSIPGKPRTGEAPSTSADAPNAGATSPDSGAPATVTPADEGAPAEATPADAPRTSELCARLIQVSREAATRAGCRPSDNESGH